MDDALISDQRIERVIRALDRFISPAILDGGEPGVTRARMLLAQAGVMGILGLLSSAYQMTFGAPRLALPGLIMAAAVLLIPRMLRRSGSHVPIGGLLTGAVFIALSLANLMTAGQAVVGVIFIAVVPLIGSLSQNLRWGLFWSGVALCELVAVYWAVASGVVPLVEPNPVAVETAYLRGALLVTFIVSAGCALHGVFNDYSLRRATDSERHLLENRKRYLEMFSGSPDGLMSISRGRVEFVSKVLSDLLGYAGAGDLAGMSLRDIVRGADVGRLLDESIPAGSVSHLECQLLAADGSAIDVDLATSHLLMDGERGQVLRVRDRRALRAADREVRMVRAAFAQAPVGMAILELDSEVVYVNDAFLELTALDRKATLGKRLLDLTRTPEAHDFLLDVQSAVACGELVSVPKVDWARFGGRPGFVDVRAFSVLPEHESVARWVVFVREVSRIVELEREVARSERIDSLGKLAGGIAHDFNNLLTVIMGQVDWLEDEFGSEHWANEVLATIMDACERSAALTSKILDFSRKQALRPEVFLAGDALWDMFPILHQLVPERIELEMAVADDASSPRVRCDPIRFEQVVLNLISNARDAIPEKGKISIGVRGGVAEPGGAEEVEIFVSDDGIGMRADVSDRIFDPFFTTKPSGVGTGLGLSTVHGIAHQSGGRVEVESEHGEGTTIRVFLPGTAAELTERSEAAPADLETIGGATGDVLVVEDHPAVRAVMTRSLERLGYGVVAAQNGEEARAWIEDRDLEFDALVSDIVMPGSSGVELASRFSARFPGRRIVLVSGYAEDEIGPIEQLPSEIRFVQKPMTSRILAEALRAASPAIEASEAREPRRAQSARV